MMAAIVLAAISCSTSKIRITAEAGSALAVSAAHRYWSPGEARIGGVADEIVVDYMALEPLVALPNSVSSSIGDDRLVM